VGGRACDRPFDAAHYYPRMHHLQWQAESARRYPDFSEPLRYSVDARQFPDFKGRGFAVFSTIQDSIEVPVTIDKSSVYRLMLRVLNPSPIPVVLNVTAESASKQLQKGQADDDGMGHTFFHTKNGYAQPKPKHNSRNWPHRLICNQKH
jgi:hypothetical protein